MPHEYVIPENVCQLHEDRFAQLQTMTYYGPIQTVLQDHKGFPGNKLQQNFSHIESSALKVTLSWLWAMYARFPVSRISVGDYVRQVYQGGREKSHSHHCPFIWMNRNPTTQLLLHLADEVKQDRGMQSGPVF